MITVGLTGGIASGKSTVAAMLVDLGAQLIDFDVVAREVVKPHLPAWKQIVEYFGREMLADDLSIDRQKLARVVFNDKQKLEKLNEIIHPAAFDEGLKLEQKIAAENPTAIIIKDIPLLIETGYHRSVDKVIVVSTSRENQIYRLLGKGFDLKQAEGRMAAQLPLEEKVKHADYIIDNDGEINETRKQVEKVIGELQLLAV